MEILFHSNAPWAPTGYGSQTGLFAPRLRDLGHRLAISSFWGLTGKTMEWDGITVYPADEEWGNRWLTGYAAHHSESGDPRDVLVLTLMDVWVLTAPILSELKMASWCPVDHMPTPPAVIEFFRRTGAWPIAMSRFGERMLADEGLEPLYVPHGIDTKLLRPIDRAEVRETLHLPEDAFVVGMVAANKGSLPPRKAFPQVFQAFAEFHRKHPDAILYLHTSKTSRDGINLIALAEVCGVPLDAIRWTPELELVLGVDYEKMAWVYSAMDVLANPSYGEGFGIPIVEAQACGTPVLVNDFSAMTELCGAGWAVGGEPFYDSSQGSWFQHPSLGEIGEALELAYTDAAGLREKARAFAVGYDCDSVVEKFWVPVLAELEQRMAVKAPVVEPGLNRAQRRAMQRKEAAAA